MNMTHYNEVAKSRGGQAHSCYMEEAYNNAKVVLG